MNITFTGLIWLMRHDRREYALNPNPVYLVAARDVAERVAPV